MTCRWVTDNRLTTFWRRTIIISAVLGLTSISGASAALATSDWVGISPAAPVVFRAPMAVSVTFREPLRAGGAQIRVLTVDGDVGAGEISTDRKTLRRALRSNTPAGKYTVRWQAYSADGRKMSGDFSFQAARGNVEVTRTSPIPSPTVWTEPSPDPIPTAEIVDPGKLSETAGPSADPMSSQTPGWITASDPVWTPQPTATVVALAPGGSGGATSDRAVSTGFTVIPLAVGGFLVFAAGMVSVVNRPRLSE
jgi:methionine-rich copper-binding protein CopC